MRTPCSAADIKTISQARNERNGSGARTAYMKQFIGCEVHDHSLSGNWSGESIYDMQGAATLLYMSFFVGSLDTWKGLPFRICL
jgi:hypothetical protein